MLRDRKTRKEKREAEQAALRDRLWGGAGHDASNQLEVLLAIQSSLARIADCLDELVDVQVERRQSREAPGR